MYPQSMFQAKIRKKKNTIFHLKIIYFTAVKNCSILHGRVFVMVKHRCGPGSNLDKDMWQGRGHPFKVDGRPPALRFPPPRMANIRAFKNAFINSMSFL